MAFRTRKLSRWGLTVDASEKVGVEVELLEAIHHLEIVSLLDLGGVLYFFLNLFLHKIIINLSSNSRKTLFLI